MKFKISLKCEKIEIQLLQKIFPCSYSSNQEEFGWCLCSLIYKSSKIGFADLRGEEEEEEEGGSKFSIHRSKCLSQADSTPRRWKIMRKRVSWAAKRVERLSIRFHGHEYLSLVLAASTERIKRRAYYVRNCT